MTRIAATTPAVTPRPALTNASATPPTSARGAADTPPALKIPEWVKDAVFYQVFPDRFANGDVGNDPQGTQPWGSKPTNDGFMGGDLLGLEKKLPYLNDLGVNALYLNPVFSSPSNHKYNTTDYENVDPHFGGNKALSSFVDAAHGTGMKVMLDGVFNHTSHEHGWFADVREKGPKSEHWDKFDVKHWPIRYEKDKEGVLRSPDYKSWWNYATLPELHTTNPKVRDYFLRSPNSIVKRWLNEGMIDGWRMDVADEVEPDFWREARTEIKKANPDAYLLAENWHNAGDYLKGDQFDGAMNYKYFQQPAIEFFAKKQINADQFVSRLANEYSTEAKFGAFNLLDSHDTPRFITEAGGDWYRQRAAAIFQMTYVGAPVVYYGNEVGLEGAKDPDSRRAFPWTKVEAALKAPAAKSPLATAPAAKKGVASDGKLATQQLHGLYKQLIKVRKDEESLRRGDFTALATHNENKTVAYRRAVAGQARDAVVAINNDSTHHAVEVPVAGFAPDGTAYTDALTGSDYVVRNGALSVPRIEGHFGAVLLRKAGAPAGA